MENRRKDRWRDKPKLDRAGQKFGMLLILNFSRYQLKNGKGRKLFWNCVCECGNKKEVENSNLISGNTYSCGCSIADRLKKLHEGNVKDDIAFKYVLREYVKSAKERNYEFSLSEIEFRYLTQQNCFYCGIEPKQIKYKNGGHIFKKSIFIYNGIDRKDNNEGYTLENCVPCCRICNISKAEMPIDAFFLWISRVYEFNMGKNK